MAADIYTYIPFLLYTCVTVYSSSKLYIVAICSFVFTFHKVAIMETSKFNFHKVADVKVVLQIPTQRWMCANLTITFL